MQADTNEDYRYDYGCHAAGVAVRRMMVARSRVKEERSINALINVPV